MNDEDIARQIFQKIKNAPIPETEFFVTWVMARLEDGPSAGLRWWERSWKAPALVLALATLFLVMTSPIDEVRPSTDEILMTNCDKAIGKCADEFELELDSMLNINSEEL